MIIHRLSLTDFRGVTREVVEVPERGVLVIEGPNESGKTSLVDALEMLLEHKASSGRAEIKAASPVGRDVPVVVEAEFTVAGQRMRYRKEFVRGKRTTLEFPGSASPALSGDDAHEYVRDLMDRKVDRSLWRALRIAQDEPVGQVDASRGMDSLRRALDAAAGGEDPTGDDSLIARVAEERNRYLTAGRGTPTGELARSEVRVEKARAALAEARAGHAELDAAVEDHAARVTIHRARAESLVTVESEVARLEEAGRVVAERRQTCTAADAAVDRAAAAYDEAVRGARERATLVGEVERERSRAEELRRAATEAGERVDPAEARAAEARALLDEAETDLTRVRARMDRMQRARERELRRSEIERLEKLVQTVRSVGAELAETESEAARLSIPDGSVDRIREADEDLREAIVRSAASAPTVEVSGVGQVTVAGQIREIGDGWSQQIVDDTVFEVGTVSLTVVPAGDTETVRRDEAAARSRLATLLADIGVGSRVQAEERARALEERRTEARALRRRRADLLAGESLDDLVERMDRLRTQLGEDTVSNAPAGEPADGDADAGDETGSDTDTDPAEAVRIAERTVADRRSEDRTAVEEAESARTHYATKIALAEQAEKSVRDKLELLEAARREVADTVLTDAEARACAELERARDSAREARSLLEEALAVAPPELLENARASLKSLRDEERDSAAAVATALGRVNAIGEQGRLGDVSQAESELEEAERENSALWRRARAADLLYRTLTARRTEALRAYQEPYHRAIVELGRLVYGRDFDVSLDENLTIRSRRIGETTVDYGSLSGGAREQLAVIARIACARLVGDGGVPVFLDDTMGYTDPNRRLAMGAVIAAAASTSQIIVLTCDRARFAGIGGARTHVMGGGGAPADEIT